MSEHARPFSSSAPIPPTPPPAPPVSPPWPAPVPPGGASSSTRTVLLVLGIGGGLLALLVVVPLVVGLLLPALGAARSTARSIKAQTQLKAIGAAMVAYANENGGAFPEAGADLGTRLAPHLAEGPAVWVSPNADAGSAEPSFIVVAADSRTAEASLGGVQRPLMIENPAFGAPHGSVLFSDGDVQMFQRGNVEELLRRHPRCFTPKGEPWTPTPR